MNWHLVKPKMKEEFKNVFGKHIDSILELFYDVISYENPIKEIREALELRYETEKVSDLMKIRDLLASKIETFFKRVFEYCEIRSEGEMSACFHQFFNDFFEDKFRNRPKFMNDKNSKSPKELPSYFKSDLEGFGESLKTIYDLRNAYTHEGKIESKISYPNSEISLTDETLFIAQIKHCLKAYLFIVSKYHKKLSEGLATYRKRNNTDFEPYLEKVYNLLTKEEKEHYIELRVAFGKRNQNEDMIHAIRKQNNRLFILGGAGTGKTMTLKYLAAQEASHKEFSKIPVYIELGQVFHNQSIKSFISEKLADFSAESLLETGSLSLYIDALDEFPLKDIEHIKKG